MPDLTIKPNSGSGNKVIIQDQAGAAVLTTADSGATMASNVTGIPAAGVTGVLPVGVTGGSGLTALGTVASGNLSNTAIVYPAGHVIGMWSNYRINNSSVVTTNTGGTDTNTDGLVGVNTGDRVYSEELSVTVDVSSTTSDLFVIGTVGVGNQAWSNKGAYGMVLNIPSPTTNYAYQTDNYPYYPAKATIGGDMGSSYGVGMSMHTSVEGSDSRVRSGSYAIKIYVYAYNEASPSGTQTINVYNSYITVFEIKR